MFLSLNLVAILKTCVSISAPLQLMELAAFLPNRRGAAIDLLPSKGSDIQGKHRLRADTCGSAFIHVLWSLNLAAILTTCVSIYASLHFSWWNRQRFYRIGEVRLLIHHHLKATGWASVQYLRIRIHRFSFGLGIWAILKTCASVSAPLQLMNWRRFYQIGEMRLLIYQHLKAQTYGVSIG